MIIHPVIDAAASKKQKKLEHIAFIMDGDGRWATKRGMPHEYGHTVGAKVFRPGRRILFPRRYKHRHGIRFFDRKLEKTGAGK